MSQNSTVVRKYKQTPYERSAMEVFNRDLHKQYQRISDNPGERAELVRRAFKTHPDRYQLCREVVRVTRLSHDNVSERFATTINKSFRMLARDGKKPVVGVATA